MTAKHRKGKNNHRQEENSFKDDSFERGPRNGKYNTSVIILFFLIGVGVVTSSWFFTQQLQTIGVLTDNLRGVQLKIAQLQTLQEEVQKVNAKLYSSEGYEQRLFNLEEEHRLLQKHVEKSVTTIEELRSSELAARVSTLHTQMNTRLNALQETMIPRDEMIELQSLLEVTTKELDLLKQQVTIVINTSSQQGEHLKSLSDSVTDYLGKVDSLEKTFSAQDQMLEEVRNENSMLVQNLEGLTSSNENFETLLKQHTSLVHTLSSQVVEHNKEILNLKDSAASQKVQLDTSGQELTNISSVSLYVRKVLLVAQSQRTSLQEELQSLQSSLAEQSRDVQNTNSELRTKLDSVQEQISQNTGQWEQKDSTFLGEVQNLKQELDQLEARVGATVQSCFSGEVEMSCEECSWPLEHLVQFSEPAARLPVISLGLTQASPGIRVRVADPGQSGFKVLMDRAGETGPSTIKASWIACA
ncbi:hyaluronan mediated motility receptor isoform X1 [Lepisosteus oculatus]|uniref:hyaluronan mediated motility receptor isoform X1 n=1 Tax=Lepisosteus oculatus TaxID=7918 RepID=UPI00371E5ED3